MQWLKKRLKERSTYEGLSALAVAIGLLFKADGAAEVGQVVNDIAEPAMSGDLVAVGGAIALGVLRIFKTDYRP